MHNLLAAKIVRTPKLNYRGTQLNLKLMLSYTGKFTNYASDTKKIPETETSCSVAISTPLV